MTNFDFLKNDAHFSSFCQVAIASEHLLHIDPCSCVISCRRAMEFAVKWIYENDEYLSEPKADNLVALLNNKDFEDIVGSDILKRMNFIRKVGNSAAHDGRKITKEVATLCLENLFVFLDYVSYCYSENYKSNYFNPKLLEFTAAEALSFVTEDKQDVERLIRENKAMKKILSQRRKNNHTSYIPKPLDKADFNTRKMYIEAMLEEAGWIENKDYKTNVSVGIGKHNPLDFVLYRDNSKPCAIIEIKHSTIDFGKGRKTAQKQSQMLENKYNCPVHIFLSNGFDTKYIDRDGNQINCDEIYTKDQLLNMIKE